MYVPCVSCVEFIVGTPMIVIAEINHNSNFIPKKTITVINVFSRFCSKKHSMYVWLKSHVPYYALFRQSKHTLRRNRLQFCGYF